MNQNGAMAVQCLDGVIATFAPATIAPAISPTTKS